MWRQLIKRGRRKPHRIPGRSSRQKRTTLVYGFLTLSDKAAFLEHTSFPDIVPFHFPFLEASINTTIFVSHKMRKSIRVSISPFNYFCLSMRSATKDLDFSSRILKMYLCSSRVEIANTRFIDSTFTFPHSMLK